MTPFKVTETITATEGNRKFAVTFTATSETKADAEIILTNRLDLVGSYCPLESVAGGQWIRPGHEGQYESDGNREDCLAAIDKRFPNGASEDTDVWVSNVEELDD